MQKVTVRRDELLAKLRENRTNHRAVFERAVEGYRKEAIGQLEDMLGDARAGKRIRRGLDLVQPMDQTKEYDRVITMLEMAVADQVELTGQEFAMFVCDDWGWKDQFTTSTSRYIS